MNLVAGAISLFCLVIFILAANAVLHIRRKLDLMSVLVERHVREAAQHRAQQGYVPPQPQSPYGGQQ